MTPIEKAYKAWRATVPLTPIAVPAGMVRSRRRLMTPTERARHAVRSYWATLTPEQRSERQRKAARKMWKRRKAERRA